MLYRIHIAYIYRGFLILNKEFMYRNTEIQGSIVLLDALLLCMKIYLNILALCITPQKFIRPTKVIICSLISVIPIFC